MNSDLTGSNLNNSVDKIKEAIENDFMNKFTNLDLDEDEEYEERTKKIKESFDYKSFERTIDNFIGTLYENNILAKRDWSCCSTCGFCEIGVEEERIKKDEGKEFMGTMFYHLQDTDSILDQIENKDSEIIFYMAWDVNPDKNGQTNYDNFGKKVEQIGSDCGIDVKCNDIKTRIKITVKTGH